MGLGRRNFLKLTSIALAGFAVDPLNAVAVNNDIYVNKKLGILFSKPKNWGFVAVKEFGRLKNEQIIGTGLDEDQEQIWKELGDPICVATKYYEDKPEYKGIFSPTITLDITPKEELIEIGLNDMAQIMEISEIGVSMILKDFEVIKIYEPYVISNCQFYEYDATYLFEHIELKDAIPVELKVLKTEHNGFYYDFNCHQSKAVNQLADKEFELFKKSIKLI